MQKLRPKQNPSLLPPLETDEALIKQMTTPSEEVCRAVQQLDGDVMILGVAGKMGPTLAELLVNAGAKKVIGVSRFSNPAKQTYLNSVGVRTIKCDLLNEQTLRELPDAPNIFLLAGHKFGASENKPLTWALNTLLPAIVMERFPSSRIVYVSSGNVYPFTNTSGKGATEKDLTEPVGEYAQSRLGGERLVQFLAEKNKTPTAIIRLFYATELRYGIILDIAQKVMDNKPINLGMGYMNQIWQGDANACLARSFPLCEVPARVINLTGTDVLSVRKIANQLGGLLNRQPVFEGEEKPTALLGDASAATSIFGQPAISPEQITHWVADWVKRGGTTLGKPTKFEVRSGEF